MEEKKVVLITGGAMGQGRAHAYKYAENGFKVVLADILDQTQEALKQKNENGDEDFKEEIKMMRKSIRREMIRFIIELKREFKTIKKGIKMIRCLKESI